MMHSPGPLGCQEVLGPPGHVVQVERKIVLCKKRKKEQCRATSGTVSETAQHRTLQHRTSKDTPGWGCTFGVPQGQKQQSAARPGTPLDGVHPPNVPLGHPRCPAWGTPGVPPAHHRCTPGAPPWCADPGDPLVCLWCTPGVHVPGRETSVWQSVCDGEGEGEGEGEGKGE